MNPEYSTIEKIGNHVYYACLNIPEFIERNMKGFIPSIYGTSKAIDLAGCEPVLRFCVAEELERVAGARVLKRQVEWLCGRVVLKDLLLSVMFPGSSYHDIVIYYNISGRPCIRGHENICVSVTHSGDVAMASVHTVPDRRIGIDVEQTGGIDIDAVLSVAFSSEERSLYKNKSVNEIISAFTMKEAYLKITGQGFHEVITKITVRHNKIFYEGMEVPGLGAVTFSCKNEYITSIIYEQ